MSYILYGDLDSGSFTAEALFAELGVGFELKTVDLDNDVQAEDPFKAINPAAKLPVLVLPDGTIVTESAAVLLTICARHADAKLFPDLATSDGAWALRWLMFVSNNIYEAVGRTEYPGRYTSNYYDRWAIEASARSEIRWFWILLEREIADRNRPGPWALGDTFSALDIYIANLVGWFTPIEWRGPNIPRLEAIRLAVAARPRIAPIYQRYFATKESERV